MTENVQNDKKDKVRVQVIKTIRMTVCQTPNLFQKGETSTEKHLLYNAIVAGMLKYFASIGFSIVI